MTSRQHWFRLLVVVAGGAILTTSVAAEQPVRQISGGNPVQQVDGGNSVKQISPTSRPKPPPATRVQATLIPRTFILVAPGAPADPVVGPALLAAISPDDRSVLPSIGGGVSVSLPDTASGGPLPNVGSGAVAR